MFALSVFSFITQFIIIIANFLYIFTIQVEFVVADITTADFKPESFDVIYSRDTILHIEDKKSLFANFFVSLLFVTFYVVLINKHEYSRVGAKSYAV